MSDIFLYDECGDEFITRFCEQFNSLDSELRNGVTLSQADIVNHHEEEIFPAWEQGLDKISIFQKTVRSLLRKKGVDFTCFFEIEQINRFRNDHTHSDENDLTTIVYYNDKQLLFDVLFIINVDDDEATVQDRYILGKLIKYNAFQPKILRVKYDDVFFRMDYYYPEWYNLNALLMEEGHVELIRYGKAPSFGEFISMAFRYVDSITGNNQLDTIFIRPRYNRYGMSGCQDVYYHVYFSTVDDDGEKIVVRDNISLHISCDNNINEPFYCTSPVALLAVLFAVEHSITGNREIEFEAISWEEIIAWGKKAVIPGDCSRGIEETNKTVDDE